MVVETSVASSVVEDNPVQSSSSSPTWDSSFDEATVPPTPEASARLGAEYLCRFEHETGEALTHSEVARYCRSNGFSVFDVLNALVRFRTGDDAYSVDALTFSTDDDAWAVLKANNETACCPIPDWRMGARTGEQRYGFHDCASLSCPKHSVPKAEALLEDAKRSFICYDAIFYATVDDDPVNIDRVRSRRRSGRHPERAAPDRNP